MTTLTGTPAPTSLRERKPAPSLRERKKEETRTAIHEAALRLVAENGAPHTSIDAICSEAGVSTRTFFNYFPSKVAAILGLHGFEITDAQRQAFLATEGDRLLVRDVCTLVGGILDGSARAGADREALRELLVRRPEVAPEVIRFAGELRHGILQLVEQRTTPARAQLAVTLVMGAVDCALHRPLDSVGEEEFTGWLFETVTAMQELARESLD
jgi:AcrR family transcriptional regulator